MLQCVAVFCKCVATCRSVWWRMLQCVAVWGVVELYDSTNIVESDVLQYAAVCCSVLQVCCSVRYRMLQCIAVCGVAEIDDSTAAQCKYQCH